MRFREASRVAASARASWCRKCGSPSSVSCPVPRRASRRRPSPGARRARSSVRLSVPSLPPWRRGDRYAQVRRETAMRPSRFRVRQRVVPRWGAGQSTARGLQATAELATLERSPFRFRRYHRRARALYVQPRHSHSGVVGRRPISSTAGIGVLKATSTRLRPIGRHGSPRRQGWSRMPDSTYGPLVSSMQLSSSSPHPLASWRLGDPRPSKRIPRRSASS